MLQICLRRSQIMSSWGQTRTDKLRASQQKLPIESQACHGSRVELLSCAPKSFFPARRAEDYMLCIWRQSLPTSLPAATPWLLCQARWLLRRQREQRKGMTWKCAKHTQKQLRSQRSFPLHCYCSKLQAHEPFATPQARTRRATLRSASAYSAMRPRRSTPVPN